MKVFIPLYLVTSGHNTLIAGSFLTTSEIIHILLRPLGGLSGDKLGFYPNILFGLILLSIYMFFVSYSLNTSTLFIPAIFIGISEATVLPSAIALVSLHTNVNNIGTVMGIIGSLRNFGKVFGPIFIGILINIFSYKKVFQIIGLLNLGIILSIIFIAIILILTKLNTGKKN